MNWNRMLLVIAGVVLFYSPILRAQISPSSTKPVRSFEVATVKASDPNAAGAIGFLSYPGGRILLGRSTVKMMMYFAYDIPASRITGGPDWVGRDLYEITAMPPDSSESRTAKQPPLKATPSAEQREMLRSLLNDRFALEVHHETRQGPVYLLTRGSGNPNLHDPKDKAADARFGVMEKSGGIADGEAFGTNVSMAFLAEHLGLDLPVVNLTGLKGSYDFHLDPDQPENRDYHGAVLDAMNRLGLKLKRGTGPVATIVIDHVEKPSDN